VHSLFKGAGITENKYQYKILSHTYVYLFSYFKKYIHAWLEHVILYCRFFLCTPFVRGGEHNGLRHYAASQKVAGSNPG
jgi:hypothetical protein